MVNEDLFAQVRGLTDNLSGVVEPLLAGYAEHEHRPRLAKIGIGTLEATLATWNDFDARRGSFAGKYSTFRSLPMAQFDVHRNIGKHRDDIAYVVRVRSSRYDSGTIGPWNIGSICRGDFFTGRNLLS